MNYYQRGLIVAAVAWGVLAPTSIAVSMTVAAALGSGPTGGAFAFLIGMSTACGCIYRAGCLADMAAKR